MVVSRRSYLIVAALLASVIFLRPGSAAVEVLLNGGGSTFMYPIESAWTGRMRNLLQMCTSIISRLALVQESPN
jgi:hypothetical protein